MLSPVTSKLISDVASVASKTRLNKIIKLYVLQKLLSSRSIDTLKEKCECSVLALSRYDKKGG